MSNRFATKTRGDSRSSSSKQQHGQQERTGQERGEERRSGRFDGGVKGRLALWLVGDQLERLHSTAQQWACGRGGRGQKELAGFVSCLSGMDVCMGCS